MKAITFFIGAMLALGTAACDTTKDRVAVPNNEAVVEIDQNANGGPCGDGSALGKNENCK